jgi:2OG-Fe(II) oxygenase superfamily
MEDAVGREMTSGVPRCDSKEDKARQHNDKAESDIQQLSSAGTSSEIKDATSTPISFFPDQVQVEEIAIDGGSKRTITNDKEAKSLLGIRLIKIKSVVTLSNMLSPEELDYLVHSSLHCAANQTIRENANDRVGRVCARMPTHAAASRNDIPDAGTGDLHDPLPLDVSSFVEERILKRVMAYIDQHLLDLVQTLFGNDCSLSQLFVDGQLEWSTREPAVNVYYPPNGHFGIHKDNKALTILMPLTSGSGSDFTGGGTAFWSQSHPNEHGHAPSLIMTPKAGTAVLFGGMVSHKGLAIHSGKRVVFVASFSRRSRGHKTKTWLVSAR